jgi:shikimate 5-dehydrogenase
LVALQAGSFRQITFTAKELDVVNRTRATFAERNDVVELKVAYRATLDALALVALPHSLLNVLCNVTAIALAGGRDKLPLGDFNGGLDE